MKKELFVLAGVACFGDSWKSQVQRELGVKNRQTITKWVEGINNISDNVNTEMLAMLKVRQQEINNAIKALEIGYDDLNKQIFIDYDRKYTVVSDNGHLLDEQFDTLAKAKAWVQSEFDEDDLYLVKYHEMTEAENLAMQVIQEYADLFEREDILNTIQSKNNTSEKSEQEIYKDLAVLIAHNEHSADYFDYYLANELMFKTERLRKKEAEYLASGGIITPADEEYFIEREPTITYKRFLMQKINAQVNFIAEYL